MTITADWKQIVELCQSFTIAYEDIPYLSPCLTFEAFVWYAEGPETLDFYEKVREVLGKTLTHYHTGSGTWSAINKRAETLVPTWCDNPTPWPKKQYYMEMSAADADATAASMRIDFNARAKHPILFPYSDYYLTLPLDHPLVTDNTIVDWLCNLKILESEYLISATCGLGIQFPYNYPSKGPDWDMRGNVGSLLSRYPGLDIQAWRQKIAHSIMTRDPEFLAQHPIAPGRPFLKRVNWLTILSKHQISHLGGLSALQHQFQSEPKIKLHAIGEGVCIQAGTRPQLGSREHRDLIPLYQKVARVVHPVRLPALKGTHLLSEFNEVGLPEWHNAFE